MNVVSQPSGQPGLGQPGGLSLPGTGRARPPGAPLLSAGQRRPPHVRPFLGALCQAGPHRVVQNIISLVPQTFLAAQPVFEEIPLPRHAELLGRPFFPLRHQHGQRLAVRRQRYQRVGVVGHQQHQMRPPHKPLVAKRDHLEQPRRHRLDGQLILAARLTADGQEINRVIGMYPSVNVVWQLAALRPVHADEDDGRPARNQAHVADSPAVCPYRGLVGRDHRARRVVQYPAADSPAVCPYHGMVKSS
jgi:hypothetical protein